MKSKISSWCKIWISITVILIARCSPSCAQSPAKSIAPRISDSYNAALNKLILILSDSAKIYPNAFEKAVYITENAYYEDSLNESEFSSQITGLAVLARQWMLYNPLLHYKFEDSLNVHRNFALFKVIKDTIKIQLKESTIRLLPYTYDFNDFFAEVNWNNMFVTKLLATHSGNCHSLPYLYKILADRIGASCWLSLAPNHTYISNRCSKFGWYNTELTSGDFPIDAWIMGSGYIPVQAVQSGIYMDTLSNQECLAMCILDLAKGYEHRAHNYYDGFIIRCCDLSLEYFPLNVQAMLLKAETLKHIYQKQLKDEAKKAPSTYRQMEELYIKLFDLGYREMPDKMYMQWLQSVVKERDKYSNKQVRAAVQ